jgi:hypothetical protein
VGKLFDLPEEAVLLLLQTVPYKLPIAVPQELIHEEFGDGIMSAIDFDMDLTRLPHDDRVKIVMTGKYLQYKTTKPLFSALRSRYRKRVRYRLCTRLPCVRGRDGPRPPSPRRGSRAAR